MAQPAQEVEEGAPQVGTYFVLEPVPLASTLAQYGTATAMFACFVWARDVPAEAVAGIGAFAAVFLLANQLFNRLAGLCRLRSRRLQPDGKPDRGIFSQWEAYSQSALFGAFVAGVADFAHEYIADIGVVGSALAGFVVALVFSGWRKRRNERRLYRETLITA